MIRVAKFGLLDDLSNPSEVTHLFHGLRHDLRPGLLREDLEHGEECEGERLELLELLEVAEELHGDGGGQHQQAHREHDQAPQLAAGSEDLKKKELMLMSS